METPRTIRIQQSRSEYGIPRDLQENEGGFGSERGGRVPVSFSLSVTTMNAVCLVLLSVFEKQKENGK
ncbi:hypothetical protein SLE2022_045600 [Rubroshorea leprosula]